MAANPAFVSLFTITVTTATAPINLYSILSGNAAPAGTSLGAGLAYTPTGKEIASVTIQNDWSSPAGSHVYIGDSTLSVSGTNWGRSLQLGEAQTFAPGRGSNAYVNGLYLQASTANTVIDVTVLYG